MDSTDYSNDEIQELIIRVLKKVATPDEEKVVRHWIAINSENNETWNKIKASINLNTLPEKNNTPNNIFFKFKWQITVGVFLAFSLGIITMLYFLPDSTTATSLFYTQHYVPYGSKSEIILPDGTSVWINAGSNLKYSQNFNQSSREVFLDGEAYFDVKENKEIPFWVKTHGIDIKVVGTAFNVKAYRDEKTLEATVERGNIKIYYTEDAKSEKRELILKEKQKACFNTIPVSNTQVENHVSQHVLINDNVPTELFTSWKDKQWIIEREELVSLAKKIERRYDVTIEFTSESIKHYTFSGTIEDETLEQVVKIISLTAPISYKVKGKHLILRKNKLYSDQSTLK